MSLARELAERIAAMRYDDLPPAAVGGCKVAVLDTVGVALAGAAEEAPRLLQETLDLPSGGACLILGSARRVAPLDAALVNGTSSHALDFDNTAAHLGGHVSAVMVPALLAAGEAFGATGRDLLLAHAVGYEVGGRLGRAVNYHHTEKGWHPTWTLGVFAVAAACARLLGLNAERTAIALAIATSLAGGTKANFGTMTKPLHAGECARNGLHAALLARKGYTANLAAFEHKQGFFNVYNGAGHYDAARALERWAAPLDIVEPGASYKLYPCCYSAHSAIEAALNLVRAHGAFAGVAITRIDILTAAARLAHTDRPDPQSDLEAKFSVQYCVARALLQGAVVLEHFEADAWRDPAVRALLPRVHAAPYTGRQFRSDDPFDAEVRVTLADGRALAAEVEYPLGRTSTNPIPPAQMRAKFENCARRALGPEAAAAVADRIEAFETMASVRDFTALLESGARLLEKRLA